jgi:hypothetical protein
VPGRHVPAHQLTPAARPGRGPGDGMILIVADGRGTIHSAATGR